MLLFDIGIVVTVVLFVDALQTLLANIARKFTRSWCLSFSLYVVYMYSTIMCSLRRRRANTTTLSLLLLSFIPRQKHK